jgi:hypothetical protein
MLAEVDDGTRTKLRFALLDFIQQSGLHGLALHAALEDPHVWFVKDKIAGLSADEILLLATQPSAGK